MNERANRLQPYAILAIFFLAALAFRPLLPVDETRYLSVAWEMFQLGSFFVPTLNFLPYHHKPPLLFWLIDASWAVFGPSRPAALLVVFAISSLSLHLTRRLAETLLPNRPDVASRVEWVMLGNAVFLLYSSLILFDLLLTCCVLAAFLSLHAFARSGRRRDAVVFGLLVGLGILAKGPVVLVHLVWPVLLYPWWKPSPQALTNGAFYRGVGLGLLAALVPVAVWLGPALLRTDGEFARALLWNQSAGRISGQMEASHPRPFTFYLLLLPVMLLPWLASPKLWRAVRARAIRFETSEGRALRFLLVWSGAVLATFSLISGKQPHYLVPILPLVTIVLTVLLADATLRSIRRTALALAAGLVLFQAVASLALFPRYDLDPIASFVRDHPEARFGFVGGYQGELNFLARRTQPIELVALEHADAWFNAYPGGYLIDFYRATDPTPGQPVVTTNYRGGLAGVFETSAAP